MTSAARGREVDLFTAVPQGYGNGVGLPVCLVLHGATTRPNRFREVGLPKLLTAAVQAGAPPFVLAGADGGAQRWRASGQDDLSRMLTDELPGWLKHAASTLNASLPGAGRWGGYGALWHAERRPGWLRAVAAFSPALAPGDDVFAQASALAKTPVGLWCGTEDPLLAAVHSFADKLPTPPAVESYGHGNHSMEYWTRVAEPAFRFIADQL